MKSLRIGFIGAGNVARSRHLPGLKAVEAIEITRVWSRDPATAASFAAGISAKVNDTWEAVAEASDVDAVVIATPPELHAAATLRALAAGKHVLCQARMARNVNEAPAMIAAAAKTDRVTALYPPKPGLKGDRVIQRLLNETRQIGDLREIRVSALVSNPLKNEYHWTNDPDVTGVNAMVLGMWIEILNRWVGSATRVVATARCHVAERVTRTGGRAAAVVPDSIAVAADLQCGATGSYHFSTCANSGPGHSIEIFGRDGALAYRLFADEIVAAKNGEPWSPVPIPDADVRTQSTDAEFVRAIRGGPIVTPTFQEGLAYMEFSEAVAYSALQGERVSLPLSQPLMKAWGQPLS